MNRRNPAIWLLLAVVMLGSTVANALQATRDAGIEARIEQLLSQMTLEEKIGQMTQLSDAKPEHLPLIRAGKVGSLLNVVGAEETNRFQKAAVEESRLGIPLIFGYDAIHGYRTTFPIPLAEAATWDAELVEQAAAASAAETAAAGVHWTFAPMVDIARDPRWGRISEGAGEDPYLGSVMAAARVRGFQGQDPAAADKVVACAKHYVGYGAAEGGRDYDITLIPERTLREVYLPPFKAAVDAGVLTLMSGFNDLDGIPATANHFTLTEVLRKEWGFKGFVVSDWESVVELVNHGIVATPAEAAQLAVNAGVDMDMQSGVYMKHLAELVGQGKVKEETVNESVRRILRVKFAAGLFEHPYANPAREQQAILAPEHVALARRVAQEAIVLLKNQDDILPLSKNLNSLAVIGPLADDKANMLGSWSGQGKAEDAVTVLEAIRKKLSGLTIHYAKGTEIESDSTAGFAAAVDAAEKSDVVVAVVGEAAGMSGEAASRAFLDLPGNQRQLVEALLVLDKPLVMVMMNGRPLTIPWAEERVPAILETWHLGIQAGNAIADALFGDVNPAGRLPVSFPRAVGQVPIYYNHRSTGRPPSEEKYTSKYTDLPVTPLYPFGYGLSYTSFRYSNLKLSEQKIPLGGRLVVSADVANVGQRAGDEVVQLYVRDLTGSTTRPVKELKGFRRITLAPGQSQRVEFLLETKDLWMYNREMRQVVEPGRFRLMVGPNSRDGISSEFEVTE